MVEMTETAAILHNATRRSLVVLDEIGRGTSTFDGISIAWAVAEAMLARRVKTLFATHYHELTQLAERLPRLANVKVLVEEVEGRVVFLHRIADGTADRSYGIHVAERAGLPAPVIARAREVLAELERERTVEHLEAAGEERAARRAREKQSQLGLFGAAEPPVVAELRELDLDRLTPLEALQRLSDWKSRLS
jgi:DNA mismatch repair protein MutS